MKIVYAKQAKEQLRYIKEFISSDSKTVTVRYLFKMKEKIEILSIYPYIGKINATMNIDNIRDFVILGYKVIYKINKYNIIILAIYKHIDFDEKNSLN